MQHLKLSSTQSSTDSVWSVKFSCTRQILNYLVILLICFRLFLKFGSEFTLLNWQASSCLQFPRRRSCGRKGKRKEEQHIYIYIIRSVHPLCLNSSCLSGRLFALVLKVQPPGDGINDSPISLIFLRRRTEDFSETLASV